MNSNLEQAAPHEQVELEKRIIGALALDPPGVMARLADRLESGAFYLEPYRTLYVTFKFVYMSADFSCTKDSVYAILDTKYGEGHSGKYITALIEAEGDAAKTSGTDGVEGYATLINDAAKRRWLEDVLQRSLRANYNPQQSVDSLITNIHSNLERIDELGMGNEITIRTATEEVVYAKQFVGRCDGWSTGFSSIDEMSSGFTPGEVWTIGGMAGTGKSRIDIYMASRLASSVKIPTAIINLEMAPHKFGQYFTSTIANLRNQQVTPRMLFRDTGANVDKRWEEAELAASDVPVYALESITGASCAQLLRWSRQLQRLGVRVVFIDQVQRIKEFKMGQGDGGRGYFIEITDTAKEIASLGMCVVLLHQVHRAGYDGAGMGNLYGTAALEHASDHVLIMSDPQRRLLNKPDTKGFVMKGPYVIAPTEKDIKAGHEVHTDVTHPRPITLLLDKTRGESTGRSHMWFDFRWGVQVDQCGETWVPI